MSEPWRGRLIVLRHGQSEWNAAGVFTGWANAHLTAHGEDEAGRAGALLAEAGMLPAFVHPRWRRAGRTASHAAYAVEFANVILACEQGHAHAQCHYAERRCCDVFHCPTLPIYAGQSLPHPDPERAI
jgi:bisphosphoglycerate-dependent phosphoglycerate mutase